MNPQRKRIVIMLGIGALALVVLWRLPGKKHADTPQIESSVAPGVPVVAATAAKPASVDSIAVILRSAWGSDPFRGGTTRGSFETADNPLWVCRGILYSDQIPMAYVNNRLVKVGDQVDEARVVSIEKHQVVLDYRGARINLTVTRG